MENTESSIGFQQYWLIMKRRWLPASVVFGSVCALTAVSLLFQSPIYLAEGKLLIKKTSSTPFLTGLGREIGQSEPLADKSSPIDTEAETLRSGPIMQKTITKLGLKDKSDAPLKLKQFMKQLNVSNIGNADILLVTYKDVDPQRAAAVVNTLMDTYLENDVIANRAEAVAARDFIKEQLPTTEATVRQAEFDLRRFKEENKVVVLDEEAKSAVALIADLQRQINLSQSGIADAKAQSAVFRNQLGRNLQEAANEISINQSLGVQEAMRQVQLVETQLASEQGRFQDNHPTIVSLKSKRAELERVIQEQVKLALGGNRQKSNGNSQIGQFEQGITAQLVNSEARRLGLESQLAALSNLQNVYRQRLNNLPGLEQKQRELVRQIQASQSTYSLLLKKFQEIRIAENQNVGNARVIASALVPEEPAGSGRVLYLIAGIILSGLLAIATAFVLEATNKSIRSLDEARKLFGVTLLGVIPSFKKSEKINLRDVDSERSTPEIVVKNSPRSPFSAAYQMLQANLKFLSSDKELKVIVVTSSVPKEGKSTVSANLAVTMAQLGRKVLLVDADMHRPVQHQIWDLPNQLGLSNILVGQAELGKVIKEVMVNLDVLTSGVMPPNPMAILDSQRMASLIEVFSANYDFTIIDTPSLRVDAEAQILGKKSDGVLLVVRPGVVDSVSATLAKEFLQQSGQNVLGQVINGVIPENEPYSYYYFSKEYDAEPSRVNASKSASKL